MTSPSTVGIRAIACFAVAGGIAMVPGCALISLQNAQQSARLAAAAAANCPAAQPAADTARAAAAQAQQASQDFQTAQNNARSLRDEADRARSDAEFYRRRARDAEIEKARLEALKANAAENAAEVAIECRRLAAMYREIESDILPTIIDDSLGAAATGGASCACDSVRSCTAAAERAENDAAFLETSVHSIPEAQAEIDGNIAAADRAEVRARELEQQAVHQSDLATEAEATVKDAEERAAAAAAEAQEVAFEKCALATSEAINPPATPDGVYNQDIFNSQSIGLPGRSMGLPGGPAPLACPVSCAGITQSFCSTLCSAPVGACAQCAFCASQGCP